MEVPKMEPCVPVPIDKKIFNALVDKAKDWALMHGAGMRSKTNFNPDALNFAPFVLLPSTFPKGEFEKAVNMQTVLNELIHKIAHDYDFLKETLASTIKVDDFTKRLFDIYEIMRKEGYAQLAVLVISGFVLLSASAPTEEDTNPVHNSRQRRSFKQLPAGLLEPILPLVKAIVPEPLLGKITMLLPLPAAMDSASMHDSS